MNFSQVIELNERIAVYLNTLCSQIYTRMVGTDGNREATDFFAKSLDSFGFRVQSDEFDCLNWTDSGAATKAGDEHFTSYVSPFSVSCDIRRPIVPVRTLPELKSADINDKIALLFGEIAGEQIMPKNFPFYNPDHHKEIVGLLEKKQPAAIIAATGKNTDMAGAVYPFPLFEDGDFLIPSAYMKDVEGSKLLKHHGDRVQLQINSERQSSTGYNITGRKGDCSESRIVIVAHIDAKQGTAGATDNATGIVLLLLLAELLQDYSGSTGIELVALNGEDYYSNPGEQLFMQQNAGKFQSILLGINSDGLGYKEGSTAYSLYNCPEDLGKTIVGILETFETIVEGPQWYQGDHSIFIQNDVPALAFTTTELDSLLSNIAHTEKDQPDVVNPILVSETAYAVYRLVMNTV